MVYIHHVLLIFKLSLLRSRLATIRPADKMLWFKKKTCFLKTTYSYAKIDRPQKLFTQLLAP